MPAHPSSHDIEDTDMAEQIQQLAFRSDAATASESLGGLLDILSGAQKRNRDADLTGAIAVSGARYFQVLEGDQDAIETTLARIEADPRHQNVEVVARRPVTHRSFGAWSLASPTMLPSLKLQIDLAISACDEDCDYAIALLRSVVMNQHLNGRLLAA